MKVAVHPHRESLCYGNIYWPGKFPMRGGKFPANHPCSTNSNRVSGVQFGNSDKLRAFRERGYWASCFPEGDGITWEPLRGQSIEQTLVDIRECFGWDAALAEAPRA